MAEDQAEAEKRERERRVAEVKALEEATKKAWEEKARRDAAQAEAENQRRIWFSKPENKLLVAYEEPPAVNRWRFVGRLDHLQSVV